MKQCEVSVETSRSFHFFFELDWTFKLIFFFEITMISPTGLLFAVNPFVDRIPDDEKEAFLDDAIRQIAKKSHVYNGDIEKNTKGCRFTYNYKLIVSYARKK